MKAVQVPLTLESVGVVVARYVDGFQADVFKRLEYDGEDLQYAVVAGYDSNRQRRKFFVTATLRGEVTDLDEIKRGIRREAA
ncbi:MAG: hypothetical protein ACREGR_03515 [Minisyncoccia bacterium]